MCGLFWGAHKSLAPRARTLLGGLGQATLSFFAVATLLFVFFGECPIFCDLAKQRRKIVGGVSEVGKEDFSLYFCWRCVFFSLFYFSSAAIARYVTPDSFHQFMTGFNPLPHVLNLQEFRPSATSHVTDFQRLCRRWGYHLVSSTGRGLGRVTIMIHTSLCLSR